MKLVESWHITKYHNNIICLVINTLEKWIYYHQYNDNYYLFKMETEDGVEQSEELNIDDFLDKDKKYLRTSSQDKDQIYFYFIPYDKEFIKNSVTIKSSKEN